MTINQLVAFVDIHWLSVILLNCIDLSCPAKTLLCYLFQRLIWKCWKSCGYWFYQAIHYYSLL